MKFTWITGTEDQGKLLREFLRDNQQISRRALASIKYKGGHLEVNGREVSVRHPLCAGDKVTLTFPEEPVSEWITPVAIPLAICFEDEHVLVLNKPSFLPTIPTRVDGAASLAGAVLHYYEKVGLKSTFHAVNRLDRNTSGLLLIAKHRYVHDLFSKSMNNEIIKRTYCAIVHGTVLEEEGIISAPIGRKDDSIIEREVRSDGQRAITRFKVLKKFKTATLVQLQLETGRTHQIRVHLSHLGHPIIGDTLYGGEGVFINRQALHSSVLEFQHPFTGDRHVVESKLPEDMEHLMDQLNLEKEG